MDRYSFLVRLFHPLLHAGLSRRTNIAKSLADDGLVPGSRLVSSNNPQAKSYFTGRMRLSRLKRGQRIEPVEAGIRIASLSTPQLSQSRNCSFWPLTITGSHPMPSAGIIARGAVHRRRIATWNLVVWQFVAS